jgi:hypothetical protein
MIIELKGRIGEDGKIIIDTQTTLPPGDVEIVITYVDDSEAQDEADWEAQFTATPTSAFDKLIEEGLADYHNGQTDEFDPNIEDD